MKNYYEILGIDKTSSKDEIKQAFRKLAIENHPDKGGEKEKFQEIQEAYEILGNEEKRRNYDNGMNGRSSNFDFFFNNFHQRQHNQTIKKQNHYYNCEINLEDVHFGINKKIKVKRIKICKICYIPCDECNGSGQFSRTVQMGPFIQQITQICNKCNGQGVYKESKNTCNDCKDGKITEEKIFELQIPKGVHENKQYIFDEWGEQAIKENEISGDVIVSIKIRDHNDFKRNNLNLIYESTVTLKESIIGKEIKLDIFKEIININTKIFGIINPNKQYILYGKGLNSESDKKRGDLYIIFKIEYPERSLNDDEIKILNKTFKTINF